MADTSIDWQSVVAGVFGGGTITAVVSAMFGRKKAAAEAAKIEAEASRIDVETSSAANELLLRTIQELRNLISEQSDRIDRMDKEIVLLRTTNAAQVGEIGMLRSAIRQLQDTLTAAGVPHVSIGARSLPSET
jgi:predicted RNase H-like nuclease (RuvC/YqgF family)